MPRLVFVAKFKLYVKHARPRLITFPNTEKRVENTKRSGVFLTNFEVFGNVVKHCHYIFSKESKTKEKIEE